MLSGVWKVLWHSLLLMKSILVYNKKAQRHLAYRKGNPWFCRRENVLILLWGLLNEYYMKQKSTKLSMKGS